MSARNLPKPPKKTATADFTPILVAMHRSLFPHDWSTANPNRHRTTEYMNILGLNGHLFPNACATTCVSIVNKRPWIHLRANILHVGADTSKLIPPFSPDYFAMATSIVSSPHPPILKAFALYFTGNLLFRLNRMNAKELAFMHTALFELAATGFVSSKLIQFLVTEGYAVQDADDFMSYSYIDVPFPRKTYKTLKKCASFRRAKRIKFQMKRKLMVEWIGEKKTGSLSESDRKYASGYYERLKLTINGHVIENGISLTNSLAESADSDTSGTESTDSESTDSEMTDVESDADIPDADAPNDSDAEMHDGRDSDAEIHDDRDSDDSEAIQRQPRKKNTVQPKSIASKSTQRQPRKKNTVQPETAAKTLDRDAEMHVGRDSDDSEAIQRQPRKKNTVQPKSIASKSTQRQPRKKNTVQPETAAKTLDRDAEMHDGRDSDAEIHDDRDSDDSESTQRQPRKRNTVQPKSIASKSTQRQPRKKNTVQPETAAKTLDRDAEMHVGRDSDDSEAIQRQPRKKNTVQPKSIASKSTQRQPRKKNTVQPETAAKTLDRDAEMHDGRDSDAEIHDGRDSDDSESTQRQPRKRNTVQPKSVASKSTQRQPRKKNTVQPETAANTISEVTRDNTDAAAPSVRKSSRPRKAPVPLSPMPKRRKQN